jgi:predicted enzyme related to lactoylglutathione lyase
VHFPAHPLWFWLLLVAPFLVWLALWVAGNAFDLSLKPLTPWLWAGYCLFAIPYLFLDPVNDGHKGLRFIAGTGLWGCFLMATWIKRHYYFETLRAPGVKWYFPWKAAEFSIPTSMRILVRNIDSVSPWYIEKLGLRKAAVTPSGESGLATFRFKEDGNSVTLTTRSGFGTGATPILFTKKIGRVRSVLVARGVEVGTVEQDRQGVHYFEIHDPEGNVLEVVEER